MSTKKGAALPRDFAKKITLADRAEGIYIYDGSGRRYIDGCSGALVSSLGHCLPEVVSAISSQLKRLDFAHSSRWRNSATQGAAEEIAAVTPGDLNYIWFVSGGSEAVESAVKFARQYFVERDGPGAGKHLIMARWHSYHGANIGTLAIGGNIPRRRIFAPMFKEHPKIPAHYCYRCPFNLQRGKRADPAREFHRDPPETGGQVKPDCPGPLQNQQSAQEYETDEYQMQHHKQVGQ